MLNCTLKNGYMIKANFILCVFYHKEKIERKRGLGVGEDGHAP